MTTLETLQLYARLRGIKKHLINPLCFSLIKLLDLADHTEKMCFTLSGGNKRKLSVAISLIGSPAVVLLDGIFINMFAIFDSKIFLFTFKSLQVEWFVNSI